MFRHHKYFAKHAIFVVITVQLLVLTQAREISQCGSDTGHISNTDPKCETTYPWIYCNGATSTYCTNDECQEEFECPIEEIPQSTLAQCDSEAEGFIPNTDPTCKTKYPWVYCNGASSTYCTETDCNENFECKVEEKPAPSALATAQPITPTPIAPTPVPTTIAISSTTITTAIVRENCKINKKLVQPYPGSCRYYYHCVNGYFGIGNCGPYMFFDAISKKCTTKKPTSCP